MPDAEAMTDESTTTFPVLSAANRSPFRSLARLWAGRRGHRVLMALAAVWVLSCFDLTLTLWAEADGVLDEQNPLARLLLEIGPGAVLAFKLATLTAASLVMYHYRSQRFTEHAILVVLVAYAAVAIQWRLCYTMYEISHTGGILPAELAQLDAWIAYLPHL